MNEDKNPFGQAMTTNISGLKCDNPECDYKDDTVDSVDYEQHIDKPCPDCGESLLTQDDYDKVQQIQQQIMDLNALFADMAGMGMPTGEGDIEDDSKRIKLNKDMFGSLGDDDNMNEAIKRFNRLI
mgnify:FL=1